MNSALTTHTPLLISEAPLLLALLLKKKVSAGFPSPTEDLGDQLRGQENRRRGGDHHVKIDGMKNSKLVYHIQLNGRTIRNIQSKEHLQQLIDECCRPDSPVTIYHEPKSIDCKDFAEIQAIETVNGQSKRVWKRIDHKNDATPLRLGHPSTHRLHSPNLPSQLLR